MEKSFNITMVCSLSVNTDQCLLSNLLLMQKIVKVLGIECSFVSIMYLMEHEAENGKGHFVY